MKKILFLSTLIFSFHTFAHLGETNRFKQMTANQAESGIYSTVLIEQNAISITEYLDNSGQIFAVTWKGITHPDLSKILGSYFDQYQIIKDKEHRKMAQYRVRSEDLVIEKSGKMRNVSGKAYVVSLLPKGFNLNDLQ